MARGSWEEFAGTDRYEVVRRIGAGGMGVVYAARDRTMGRTVAIKILNQIDAHAIYRIKQEFRALSDVSHPNLVALYELVSHEDRWFFTMELVEGVDFLSHVLVSVPSPREPAAIAPTLVRADAPTERVHRSGFTWDSAAGGLFSDELTETRTDVEDLEDRPPARAAKDPARAAGGQASVQAGRAPFQSVASVDLGRLRATIAQLVEGLSALHDTGKLHRDVKPTNVLVTRQGRVVLLDFGLVTELYEEYLIRSTLEGMVCGTVAYMSPEQAGGEALTPASDWYAVGVMLFEALTGRLPFQGKMFTVLLDKQRLDAPSPRSFVPDVPEELDRLCTDLLLRDPEARPDARAIVERLGGAYADPPTPMAAWQPPAVAPPFVGRERHRATLMHAFRHSLRKTCAVAYVEGRSGVGKTALVRAFLDEVTLEHEAVVLAGRCYERELLPFKAVDSLVDSLARYLRRLPYEMAYDLLPGDIHALARIFPVLRRVDAVLAMPEATAAMNATVSPRSVEVSTELAYGARLSEPVPGNSGRAASGSSAGVSATPRRRPSAAVPRPVSTQPASAETARRSARPPGHSATTPNSGPASVELRRRAFGALRELLGRIAAVRPLVLFLDDLQWGDADSGRLLAHLLAPPDPPPLLLIATSRSEDREKSAVLSALGAYGWQRHRELFVAHLDVGPLELAEAEQLARAVMLRAFAEHGGSGGFDEIPFDDRARLIALESGGNPLFVYELAGQVPEDHRVAGPIELSESTPLRQLRLEQVLFERIRGLPYDARRLLEVVSVAAGPLPYSLANVAAGLPAAERAPGGLLRSHRFVRTNTSSDQEMIEVFHDRIRQSVLQNLSPEVMRAHHLALARALEHIEDPDPLVLVYHLKESGDSARAAQHAEVAARAAFDALAFDRAASLYGTCIELAKERGEAPDWEHGAWRAEALANAGRGAEAAQAYRLAAARADEATSLELMRRCAEQFLTSGHMEQGRAAVSEVLERVGLRYPASRSSAMRAARILRASMALKGLEAELSAGSSAMPTEEELFRIDVCWSAATGLAMVDSIRAGYFASKMLRLALSAGEPYRLVKALAFEAVVLGSLDKNPDRMNRTLRALRRVSASVRNPHARALVALASGFAAYLRGEWMRAEKELQRALQIYTEQCTGVAWETYTAGFIHVEALAQQGRLAEVTSRVHAMIAEADERDNRYVATGYRVFPFVNQVWLAADDPDEARRQIKDAMEAWGDAELDLERYNALSSEANIDLYEGQGRVAWLRLEEWRSRIDESMLDRLLSIHVDLHSLRARTALAAAAEGFDRSARMRDVASAIRGLRGLSLVHATPHAVLLEAQVSLLEGDRARATTRFREAADALQAAGMTVLAAIARLRAAETAGAAEDERGHAARVFLQEQGVRNPEAFARVWAPVQASHAPTGR